MSSVSYVDRARGMARYVEDREFDLIGDRKTARSTAERKYGIPSQVFHNLRYCPPKTIAVDLYHRLCEAVETAASRHIQQLEQNIAEARSGRKALPDGVVARAEDALKELTAFKLEGGR